MTAVTVSEISIQPIVTNERSGTAVRRAYVFVRGTTGVDYTLDLNSYLPEVADVEGVVYATDDGAVAATVPTWSTYTVTTKVAGTGEMCFVCTLT